MSIDLIINACVASSGAPTIHIAQICGVLAVSSQNSLRASRSFAVKIRSIKCKPSQEGYTHTLIYIYLSLSVPVVKYNFIYTYIHIYHRKCMQDMLGPLPAALRSKGPKGVLVLHTRASTDGSVSLRQHLRSCQPDVPEDVVSFVCETVVLDARERLSASEAMAHAMFIQLRQHDIRIHRETQRMVAHESSDDIEEDIDHSSSSRRSRSGRASLASTSHPMKTTRADSHDEKCSIAGSTGKGMMHHMFIDEEIIQDEDHTNNQSRQECKDGRRCYCAYDEDEFEEYHGD
jgi:hypothetical protein